MTLPQMLDRTKALEARRKILLTRKPTDKRDDELQSVERELDDLYEEIQPFFQLIGNKE